MALAKLDLARPSAVRLCSHCVTKRTPRKAEGRRAAPIEPPSRDTIEALLARADLNRDGRLSYEEFRALAPVLGLRVTAPVVPAVSRQEWTEHDQRAASGDRTRLRGWHRGRDLGL